MKFGICCALVVLAGVSSSASASLMGSLSTPSSGGLVGGGRYAHNPPPPNAEGFIVSWNVSQNPGGTWHYNYTFSNSSGEGLTPAVSHFILQLSANITPQDLFNFNGNFMNAEFGTFGDGPSNPGIPSGQSIFGVKINTTSEEGTVSKVSFDSTRQPMWGDFYAKGGSNNFVYNVDLGVTVANVNDFNSTPKGTDGRDLAKILVPDTIPAPSAAGLILLAAASAGRRRR